MAPTPETHRDVGPAFTELTDGLLATSNHGAIGEAWWTTQGICWIWLALTSSLIITDSFQGF